MAIIRIARFWPTFQGRVPLPGAGAIESTQPETVDSPELDGLDAFGSEVEATNRDEHHRARSGQTEEPPRAPNRSPVRRIHLLGLVLLFVATAAMAAVGVWTYRVWTAQPSVASLVLETTPVGADVIIGDRVEGKTPLTLELEPGQYDIQLVSTSGQKRELAVALTAGASVLRHIEFAAVPPAAPSTGTLHVQTDPARLAVSVDGIDRGLSPVTVNGLEPGDHQVAVRSERGVVRRRVSVRAGNTVSLVVSPVESNAVLPGWLTLSSPVTMQLKEDGRLIGTTEAERLMLPAGDHEIEVINETLGYRAVRKFNVPPGKTTKAAVELPMGSLNINALPWAEVWVDGERIGQTPIANLVRRLGTYEVVFRHPQFGERRATVTVTARQPARVGLDMRRQ